MNERTILKKKTIIIGRVIKPHGIYGGVKIKPFTEDWDGFSDYDVFSLRGHGSQELTLKVNRIEPLNGFFVIYFEGIDTPEKAEEMRDMFLQVPRATVAEKKHLSEEDVLIEDLIGYRVYEENTYLGYVGGFYEGGVNGLYLVKGDIDVEEKGNKLGIVDKDFFIPCDLNFYSGIDFEKERILLAKDSVLR